MPERYSLRQGLRMQRRRSQGWWPRIGLVSWMRHARKRFPKTFLDGGFYESHARKSGAGGSLRHRPPATAAASCGPAASEMVRPHRCGEQAETAVFPRKNPDVGPAGLCRSAKSAHRNGETAKPPPRRSAARIPAVFTGKTAVERRRANLAAGLARAVHFLSCTAGVRRA